MNYIQEMNSFYEWLDTNPMPSSAIALWHALMQINNRSKWSDDFTAAVSTLQSKTGFDRKSIFRARQILADKGRLIWTPNGQNHAAGYRLIPFGQEYQTGNIVDKKPLNRSTSRPIHGTPEGTINDPKDGSMEGTINDPKDGSMEGTINKQNKINETKENNNEEDKSSMSSGDDPAKLIRKVFDDYNQICKNLPTAKLLTDKREHSINARLQEHGYENILVMLRNAGTSNFLAGDNQCQWVATFDWLFRPTNFAKVLEGNYVYNRSAKSNKSEFVGKPSPLELIEEAYNGIINKQDEY